METAITMCNHASLAFALSRNPNCSSKNAAKIVSFSSLLPNQLMNCRTLSSAALTKKSSVSHVQCSAAGPAATVPSGNSFVFKSF